MGVNIHSRLGDEFGIPSGVLDAPVFAES